jgi:predicted RNA binding protein YcfA (HicA-like mRNA interferase family)
MNSRQVIRRLEADGWVRVRTRGSHCQFKHPDRPGLITVPHPKKDLPTGTVRAIMKQAGWSKP